MSKIKWMDDLEWRFLGSIDQVKVTRDTPGTVYSIAINLVDESAEEDSILVKALLRELLVEVENRAATMPGVKASFQWQKSDNEEGEGGRCVAKIHNFDLIDHLRNMKHGHDPSRNHFLVVKEADDPEYYWTDYLGKSWDFEIEHPTWCHLPSCPFKYELDMVGSDAIGELKDWDMEPPFRVKVMHIVERHYDDYEAYIAKDEENE